MARLFLETFEDEFHKTKAMADKSIGQLTDEELHFRLNPLQNSVATIMQHMAGNMLSRWIDFLTTDGEKPTRNREAEFLDKQLPRDKLLEFWNTGWNAAFNALAPLTDADLARVVTIRNEPHTVLKAINRQTAHYAWHAAQIALIAKHLRQQQWNYLTIPPGGSNAFNQKMGVQQNP
jgi:hypothetical protein